MNELYDAGVTFVLSNACRITLLILGFLQVSASFLCAEYQQPASPAPFLLKDHTTVAFFGDSITAQRFYTRFVEDFVLTRYPGMHIEFVNAGVPGDTVYGGYAGAMAQRVERDVAPAHPAMITVMLGMNDGGYGYTPTPVAVANFDKGYESLLVALRASAPAATLTLIRPTPYDEITHGTEFPKYEAIVNQLSNELSHIGTKAQIESTPVVEVDFHTPLVEALTRAKAQFPQLAPLLIPDRIHPAENTHWIMAAALLQAWHVDPVVSRVAFDAQTLAISAAERASVTELQAMPAGIRWKELDEALPLPLDLNNEMTDVVLKVSEVEKSDQEILQVKDLRAGQYQLLIDAKLIAVFTADSLAGGVNLALQKTPMLEQARGIDYLEERRAQLDMSRFVLSAEVKQDSAIQAAEDGLREAQQELDSTVRMKLVPKLHTFELRRQ